MYRYIFESTVNKKANDLLNELRQISDTVVGCCVILGQVTIDFSEEPDKTLLTKIADHINAKSYIKVEELEEVI